VRLPPVNFDRSQARHNEPGLVDVPSPWKVLSGLAHSAASALGWKLIEVTAETASTAVGSPGVGTAVVHGARTLWTWEKIGRGIAEGNGVSIAASVQEQHGFSIEPNIRLGSRRGVAPLGLDVGWSPAESGRHPTVDIRLDRGVAPVQTPPEPSGCLDIRWFEPARQLSGSPALQHRWQLPTAGKGALAADSLQPSKARPPDGWPPPGVGVRAGLVDAVHLAGGCKLKPRRRIAVLMLTAPVEQVLRDIDVLGPDTVLTYAVHLGLVEVYPWAPGWYLHTGSHGSLAGTPRCRIRTVVYLDPETFVGAIVEIPASCNPRISHLAIRNHP
jgi:hypothetical protein